SGSPIERHAVYVVSTNASAAPMTSAARCSRIAVNGLSSLNRGFAPVIHAAATLSPSQSRSIVHTRYPSRSWLRAARLGAGPPARAHADGMPAQYSPDFIVRTEASIYVVETKAQTALSDENVRRKQNAALGWVEQINGLEPHLRMDATWSYVLLGEEFIKN